MKEPLEFKLHINKQKGRLSRLFAKDVVFTIEEGIQKAKLNLFPLTLGTNVAILRNLQEIDERLWAIGQSIEEELKLIEIHKKEVARVIAMAIRNNKGNYSRYCHKILMDNCSIDDLFKMLRLVLMQAHIEHFAQAWSLLKTGKASSYPI